MAMLNNQMANANKNMGYKRNKWYKLQIIHQQSSATSSLAWFIGISVAFMVPSSG